MTETGVLTTRGLRPLAEPVARWAARRRLSPAGTARIGLVLTIVAAVWFTEGTLRGALIGSALLVVVLYSDAVGDRLWDGPRDALTSWTTTTLVHLREFVLYLGLAVAGSAASGADVWPWAIGALVAHALRESVLQACDARTGVQDAGAAPAAGADTRLSPIDVVDPSRDGRDQADPAFTAELLGVAETETDTPGGGTSSAGRETGAARAAPTAQRRRPARPGRGLVGALTAFAHSERFLVLAVSITIWDVSVAFVALIVGSAVAIVSAAANRLRRTP